MARLGIVELIRIMGKIPIVCMRIYNNSKLIGAVRTVHVVNTFDNISIQDLAGIK